MPLFKTSFSGIDNHICTLPHATSQKDGRNVAPQQYALKHIKQVFQPTDHGS